MKHYTEALPDLPVDIQLAAAQYKLKVQSYNRNMKALNIKAIEIEQKGMEIDTMLGDRYTDEQIDEALNTDTCDIIHLEF